MGHVEDYSMRAERDTIGKRSSRPGMLRKTIIFLLAASGPSVLLAQDVTGTWQGSLQRPEGPALRIVMKISMADDRLNAIFYSVDQNPTPLTATSVTRDGSTVKMTFAALRGSYEGKIGGDGNSIAGTWSQGTPRPLNLTRATPETAWTIPDPPPPPQLMAADANPQFEVATVKPSRPGSPGKQIRVGPNGVLTTVNFSAGDLILFAYKLHPRQLAGKSALLEDKYDITGKPDHPGMGNDRQIRAMAQGLLKDRFQFAFHIEKKELSVYAVTLAKGGPKLSRTAEPSGAPLPSFGIGPGTLSIRNGTIADFISLVLNAILDKPVVDQTGLTDRFDFTMKYTPDASQGIAGPPERAADPADAPPDLFTAMQQQLGLKLESAKAPIDVLVIDRLEKPSEN